MIPYHYSIHSFRVVGARRYLRFPGGEEIKRLLRTLAREAGQMPVGEMGYHVFPGSSYSAWHPLSTSLLYLDTWPEYKTVHVTFLVCSELDYHVRDFIRETFGGLVEYWKLEHPDPIVVRRLSTQHL